MKNKVMNSPLWPVLLLASRQDRTGRRRREKAGGQALHSQPRKITAIKAVLEGASYQVENKEVQPAPPLPDLEDSGWKVCTPVGH